MDKISKVLDIAVDRMIKEEAFLFGFIHELNVHGVVRKEKKDGRKELRKIIKTTETGDRKTYA
jgi:hypothetical protein